MKRTIIFLSMVAAGLASCTANYENINSNPYQPGDLTADDYALGAAMNSLASGVVSTTINNAQFTDVALGGTQAGYFAGVQNWSATIENYNPGDDWTWPLMTDQTPVIHTNFDAVKAISELTGNPVPLAIATIIKVAAMNRVTDAYGPIPYTGSSYDSMEKVYDTFFAELDASIATLTDNAQAALTPSADNIFKGDVQKWIRFANSLKLRLAMRIVYAAPDKAKAMAEAAVSNEFGVMGSNADNAAFSAFGAEGNPMVFVIVGYTDYKVAADIASYMNGYDDPRRTAYFTVSEWDGTPYAGVHRGFPPVSPGRSDARVVKYSTVNLSGSAPVQWMNAAEVAFLKAEAVAVFGFDMGGTAEEFYNEGVRLSFEQWGIGGVAAYLGDTTSVPAPYIDPCTDFGNDYNRQFSTITIAWDNDASKEEMQERIITQKWIANYTLGNEAWADYRRTGYPRLIPVIANLSGGVVSSELGARRIPYPRSEYVNNTANINAAVTLLGGADNMATRLWWDCKAN